jgi:putative MATE family efflux protein
MEITLSKPPTIAGRMNIRTLVWPIFVEQLMRMSLLSVDVFMLAQYSNGAVAAVGLTSHFVFFLMLTFMIVSSGSAVLIGQNLGANRDQRAQQYSQNGLLLIILIAVVMSLIFVFMSPAVVLTYDLAPEVERYAIDYLVISGGLSIGIALSIMFSTILRAYGYSKSPMVIQIVAGLINLVGNYIAIFPPFGLPQTGVVGVAFATAISQIVSAIICWYVIKHHNVPLAFGDIFKPQFDKLKKILAIGLPNAGESISYNLAQITILFFVAQLGTAALAAAAIVQTLARFMFVFSMSLGNGTQILSSYYVGQGRFTELKNNVHHYWIVGIAVSSLVTLLMIACSDYIVPIFSDDLPTQTLIVYLLIASLFLESGRALNLIIIAALKGAGDVIFPVKVGIVIMWGVGVLSAYMLGIHWSFGLIGIWIAIGLDEWVRGIIMIFRWRSERWMTKAKLDVDSDIASE